MKKIIALLLGLVMALSGLGALAEGAEAPAFSGLTVKGALSVNRASLSQLMADMGLEEGLGKTADSLAAVLNEASSQLVVDDSGLEFALALDDTEVFSLVGEADDEGFALGSSLFPNTVLTLSMETVGFALMGIAAQFEGTDPQAALDALEGYAMAFVDTCGASVKVLQPSLGVYEMDGHSFNTRIPLQIDLEAVAAAYNTLWESIETDETIQSCKSALETLGIQVEAGQNVATEELPSLEAYAYVLVDEAGNTGDETFITVDVTEAGETAAAARLKGLLSGSALEASAGPVDGPEILFLTGSLGADGGEMRLDAQVEGTWLGLGAKVEAADSVSVDVDFFYADRETPLASGRFNYTPAGECTAKVDREGKTLMPLESFMEAEEENPAVEALTSDILSNGLPALMVSATQAVPEAVTDLLGRIMVESGE